MPVSNKVVGVVGFYLVAALVMVFVNKLVLNSTPNLPILFMFFQSVMTVLLLALTSRFMTFVELPTLDLKTARKLAPLLFVDAAGFTFNALCLRDVEAAFYQIARGLVLPLTITVVSITNGKRPALSVVGCAAMVTLGFFIGASSTAGLPAKSMPSALALLYGFLSSLAIAVHATLIKVSLPHVNGSGTQLSFWTNFGSSILLGSLALCRGEVSEFWIMSNSGGWDWTTFAWGNLVTGVFGFLISIAGILSVKVTSPVTHMFSSAARSVLQVMLGVKIFGDVITTQRAASVFMILCGTLLFTYVKSMENTAPRTPPPTMSDLEEQKPFIQDPEKS